MITNTATNQPTTLLTTTAGEYNAPGLPPGVYRIEVSAHGFKKSVRDNVTLTAAGTVRADVTLQVGQVSESIEVSASIAQVQTDNAKVTTAVQNKLVDELPLVVGWPILRVHAASRGNRRG